MKRRRIALDACCLGRRKTGNETYIRGLVDEFASRPMDGIEIVAVTTPHCPEKKVGHLRWHTIPLGNFLTRNFLTLPKALVNLEADLFHGVYWSRYWDSFPKVLTVHDISFVDFPESYHRHERWVYCALIRRAARKARHIITVSEFSKKRISDCWGIPPSMISVTYEAVEPAFKPLQTHEPSEAPYILYVGNLHPRKNLVRLLEAFTLLKKEHPSSIRLKIVGQKAWLTGDIFESVRQNRLENCVDFTGYIDQGDLVRAYQSAMLTVYPSLYEGFGFPVLEAMACGSPVVSSNTTSIPEVAGDAAILIDPLNVREMGEALWRVVSSAPLREEMRSKGLAQASRFSWSKAAKETADVYRAVLGS